MVDRKDYRKGFKLLRDPEDALAGLDGEEVAGKGKGKGRATVMTGKKSAPNDTISGAGLKDGDVLAFRFRTSPKVEVKDEEGDVMEGLEDEGEGNWDVVWPSYEDE